MTCRTPGSRRKLLEDALRQLRETRARLEAAERDRHEPIAVIGAGVRLPGDVTGLDAFWNLLREGVDAVSPLVTRPDGRRPPADERQADSRWAGLLPEIDGFDADFFGIAAAEADRMDPQQRLTLEVAWEAVEDAGLPIELLQEQTTGVFLGLYGTDYMALQLANPGEVTAYTAPGSAHSIAANRLSYLLDLKGPSFAVDTACSSSLVAVHLACRALREGDCDLALVGGVNVILSPVSTLITEKVLPLAASGRCRTFDASADGIVRSEGCAVLLLERASSAHAAGRRLRGLIRGTAVNHDGRTNGLTAPNPDAQRDVVRRALADALVDPADVAYVEAHGTGTPLGDPIEVDALREVYGEGDTPCALGSVKTNLGHLEAAAGIAGLVKAMLVLEHDEVPPHLHLDRLNPEIDVEGTRLVVPTARTSLPAGDNPCLAAVSSFGFGGANAHAILERPPAAATAPASGEPPSKLLLPLSARGEAALVELSRRYADRLRGLDAEDAAAVCAAAALQRTHHRYRVCVSARSPSELVERLEAVRSAQARRVSAGDRIGFVFSGQGSQWSGMGRELLAREPIAREEIEACDAVVRELAGWSLVDELEAPEERARLHETEVAQLTIGALQLGLAALWRSWGVEPHAVAGHSMGEIVAACAGGALARDVAFELLLRRARITERKARGGAMAALRLPAGDVEALLREVGGRVGIAAVNSPRSTVVAGEATAVDAALAAAGARGAKTRRLPVEYAFHSPLLDGCAEGLAEAVAEIDAREGDAVLYSTVTGSRARAGELDGRHWGRNLRDAVLFRAAVAAMARDGVSIFVEVGPHPVLLRDLGETLDELDVGATAVGSLRRDHAAATSLDRSLADLYRAGVDIRWEAVTTRPGTHVPLPTYPWQRRRHWLPEVGGAESLPAAAGNGAAPPAAGLAAAPPAERLEALAVYVRERIVEAADFDSIEDIPNDLPLETLGLDSLTVVELKNQVERELGITVPLTVLLEGATPIDLARVIEEALGAPGKTPALAAEVEDSGIR